MIFFSVWWKQMRTMQCDDKKKTCLHKSIWSTIRIHIKCISADNRFLLSPAKLYQHLWIPPQITWLSSKLFHLPPPKSPKSQHLFSAVVLMCVCEKGVCVCMPACARCAYCVFVILALERGFVAIFQTAWALYCNIWLCSNREAGMEYCACIPSTPCLTLKF